MFYSHVFDLILKSFTFFPLIILVARYQPEIWRFWGPLNSTPGTIGVFLLAGLLWAAIYRRGLSIISSWLYARISLEANVSISEAARLRTLFQLDMHLKWMPMREVRDIPK